MRALARQLPAPLDLDGSGPYLGMIDTTDPGVAPPEFARMLRNMYVAEGISGRRVIARPGYRVAATSGDGSAGTPLGSGANKRGQLVYTYTETDGSSHAVLICGGRFYEWNASARTFSEPVTAANFATATITLSATARCEAVTLDGKMVVTDGTNTAFMWDGGTGAASLTKLTGVPAFISPVVYYGTLVALKASDLTTFIWSEVNDPATGYDVGGFNNAWQFVQTSSRPLSALAATNEALFVYRARQAARVYGSPGPDFQSQGTRTDLDSSHGTTGRPIVTDDGVWYLDADGRPYFCSNAGQIENLWAAAEVSLRTTTRSTLTNAEIVEWAGLDAVAFGVPSAGVTWPNTWFLYSRSTRRLIGMFTGWTANRIGAVLDSASRPTLLFLGSDDGYAYDFSLPVETEWDDEVITSGAIVTTPVGHTIAGHPWGVDLTDEKWWRAIDLVLTCTGSATLQLTLQTPRGTTAAIPFDVDGTTGAVCGVAICGTDAVGGDAIELRETVGVNTFGRWAQPTLAHSGLGEGFEFAAWKPTAHRLHRHATTA
jgi:hypothetical protein